MEKIWILKNKSECRIREPAQLVGTMTAACKAVRYGWLHTKTFEQQRYLALLKNQGDYNAKMYLSSSLQADFNWWLNAIPDTYNPIRSGYILEILSGASKTGWDAYCREELTFDFWIVCNIPTFPLIARRFSQPGFGRSGGVGNENNRSNIISIKALFRKYGRR